MDRARNFSLKEIARVRKDRRHAGANPLAADDCGMANANSGNIGDGVIWTGGKGAERDTRLAESHRIQ
jgi:hypothetical protein